MERDIESELKEAVESVLRSTSKRKLLVAGPGTGKTTLFRKLLEGSPGDQKSRLVLTFLNNLKADLAESLSDLAKVYTLHGYCLALLKRHPELRAGLSENFLCFPGLASIIKRDWEYLNSGPAPQFVALMRGLVEGMDTGFYIERANYYDAVDFDDSVFRTLLELRKDPSSTQGLDLVLIDEYQDFNRMEATFIELLAEHNPIVIAGDDDQALYSQLRDASWDHIRTLYNSGEYEIFPLPFCMRCPEVIVGAVNDIILRAQQAKRLEGRIEKPYRHYEPVKGPDSRLYPSIALVRTTVQRQKANYFGRYIVESIGQIPDIEIKEANDKGDPVVLIIGSVQYRRQIETHLVEAGFGIDKSKSRVEQLDRDQGLTILKNDPNSNLGWRIILEFEKESLAASCIRSSAEQNIRLVETIPEGLRDAVLKDADVLVENKENVEEKGSNVGLTIKITSFEGAKGLSAQHVYIVGLHDGDLPRDPRNIQDIEVCRFVVGLTRTKKKCHLLLTRRFADQFKNPSVFISWIERERFEIFDIDAAYWKKKRIEE
jgi:ATP-dependent DNA helicase UvrD/PcrA